MDDLESTTAESRPWTLPAVIQNRRAPPAFEASGSGLRRVGPPTTDHPRFLRAIDASRSVSGRTSRSAGGPISVGAPSRADWLDRPDEPRTDRLDWTNWIHRLDWTDVPRSPRRNYRGGRYVSMAVVRGPMGAIDRRSGYVHDAGRPLPSPSASGDATPSRPEASSFPCRFARTDSRRHGRARRDTAVIRRRDET